MESTETPEKVEFGDWYCSNKHCEEYDDSQKHFVALKKKRKPPIERDRPANSKRR